MTKGRFRETTGEHCSRACDNEVRNSLTSVYMNISVIGTGYVGLVTGACFAEFGIQVMCMDKDDRRISALDTPFACTDVAAAEMIKYAS